MSLTTSDYKVIANRLLAKGFSVSTDETTAKLFNTLKDAGFCVIIDGVEYEGVFASRVIAVMHDMSEKSKPLEL